jgi:hypothetical protein
MTDKKDNDEHLVVPSAINLTFSGDNPIFTSATRVLGLNTPSSIATSPLISASQFGQLRIVDSASLAAADELREKVDDLGNEIQSLRRKLAEQTKALTTATAGSDEKQRRIQDLEGTVTQLNAREQLGFLLNQVSDEAKAVLLESSDFREQFLGSTEHSAFVLSVDIRRSTELMLKARTPDDFAKFTTALCAELTQIIVESLGVFDKFTGDGVLAYFPDFYSGSDAAYRVIAAADRCHSAFARHYHESRKVLLPFSKTSDWESESTSVACDWFRSLAH